MLDLENRRLYIVNKTAFYLTHGQVSYITLHCDAAFVEQQQEREITFLGPSIKPKNFLLF